MSSENLRQHIQHLKTLFQKLREQGTTLNLKKCNFVQKEAKFPGHILTAAGITQDPEKIEKIRNFKRPRIQEKE